MFDKLKDAGKSLLGLDGEHFIDPKNNTNSRGAKTALPKEQGGMDKSGPMEKGKLAKNELGDRNDDGIGNVNVTNFTITGDVEASEKDLGTGKIRVSGDTIYQKGLTNALQVPYGGKYGNLNFAAGTKDNKLPKDFIKFRIRDAVNGKWIIFPALISGITDNSSATYAKSNYIGRPDSVHVYQNRTRNISFNIKVLATNRTELPIVWKKVDALKGLTQPTFKPFFFESSTSTNSTAEEFTRPTAPYVYLTIGDMFINTPGYFESVNVTIPEATSWDIVEGRQFPHMCDIACTFVYIGKVLPTTTSKNYDGEIIHNIRPPRPEIPRIPVESEDDLSLDDLEIEEI